VFIFGGVLFILGIMGSRHERRSKGPKRAY
jgi:hypothetical protein